MYGRQVWEFSLGLTHGQGFFPPNLVMARLGSQ